MLTLKRIKFENITVYEDVDIEIPNDYNIIVLNTKDPNLTNGSGKTSMVYSILSSLNVIKSFKPLRRLGSDTDSVIEITYHDHEQQRDYTITRVFNEKSSRLDIYPNVLNIRINDKLKYFIEHVVRDVNNIYSLTHVFISGKEQLYDLSSVQILKFIEKIVYQKDLDQYLQELKQHKNELSLKYETLKSEINSLKMSIEKVRNLIDNIQKQQSSDMIQKKVDELNEGVAKINELKSSLGIDIDINFDNSFDVLNKLQDLEKFLRTKLNEFDKKLVDLKSSESHVTKRINEINKLKFMSKCPTCMRPITEHDIETMYEPIIESESKELVKIMSDRKSVEKEYSDVKNKVQTMSDLIVLYKKMSDIYKLINHQINDTNNQVSELEKNITQMSQQIDEKEKMMKKYEYKIKHVDLLIELLNIKSPVRQNFIKQYTEKMNQIAKSYSSYVLNTNEEFRIVCDDDLSITFGIVRNGTFFPYVILSNGERKRVSIIFILTILTILNILKQAPRLRVLIFDDFFNGIDNSSVLKILQMLYDFSKQYNYQIVISNNNINDIPFEYVNVEISKDVGSNVSMVNVNVVVE